MKLSSKIIAAFCVWIFISCNKPSDPSSAPGSDTTHVTTDATSIADDSIFPPANVYIVGNEWDGTHTFIKYWNNGKCFPVGDSVHNYSSTSICVSGSDVYVSGYQSFSTFHTLAQYWKNGVPTKLIDSLYSSKANAVTVSGGDVYVLEEGFYDSLPNYRLYTVKYWKNGNPVTLITRDGSAGARSIFVSGSDVYVAGSVTYEKNGINYYRAAVYWKNGKIIYLTDGSQRSEAYSIYVSGDDVYVAGYEGNTAKYWKNGTPVTLSDPPGSGFAFFITGNGSDVYVGGQYSYSNYILEYWKNGVANEIFSAEGGDYTDFTGLALSGKDVYVCGNGSGKPMYWKNGTPHVLTAYPSDHNSLLTEGIFITK